jgi:hypothetical protein
MNMIGHDYKFINHHTRESLFQALPFAFGHLSGLAQEDTIPIQFS